MFDCNVRSIGVELHTNVLFYEPVKFLRIKQGNLRIMVTSNKYPLLK